MRIFVTGGSGFIGKHTVEQLLSENHSLLLLSDKKVLKKMAGVKVVKGSLKNISKWRRAVKEFAPEAAIHLAWEGLPVHNYQLSRKNLKYGLNLIEYLAKIKCQKILVSGSCWEYGVQTGRTSETAMPSQFDSFTAAKHSLYWMGREIAKMHSVKLIWTRPFYVYGPGQQPKSLIPHTIARAMSGEMPELRNPDAKNDFIYVGDLASAFSKLLQSDLKNDIYNIGSGKLTKVMDIVEIILDEFNLKKNSKSAKKDNRDTLREFYADISRIRRETGWRPTTPLKEGILKTIRSFDRSL